MIGLASSVSKDMYFIQANAVVFRIPDPVQFNISMHALFVSSW